MESEAMFRRIKEIEDQLTRLPVGTVVYKTINGKKQPYLQWRENGKTVSKYIKIDDRENTLAEAELRRQLSEELKQLKSSVSGMAFSQLPSYKTNIVYGADLERLIAGVKKFKKRDCYRLLNRYLTGEMYGRVCVLYGLRRTGKTTLLFQAVNDLSEEDKSL